jgi:hypothetical protein
MSWDELATLTAGQRNTCLFMLRSRMLGYALQGVAGCPACACQVEFSLDARNLCGAERMFPVEAQQTLSMGSIEVSFRPLNSLDMASVAHLGSVAEARERLIQNCVLAARDDERTLHSTDLPDDVIEALAERVAESDPQAEFLLSLDCPDCAHQWPMLFDIASFFWTEISAEARRLLREVHTLAGAYGWPEQDILSMSAARRQVYLEMAS